MRRITLPVLLALGVPALAGCSFPPRIMGDPMMPAPTMPALPKPMPYPSPMPMITSAPAYPLGYPTPVLVADGSSMDDAFHYVQRYVGLHYPGSDVVAIRSGQVSLSGRIAKAGSWAFTYRVPVASTSTQALSIPSQFESRQLTFTLNGNNELFAPEVTERGALQPLDYSQVLPLGKALELCQSFGLSAGAAGVSVALVSDPVDGVVYDVDNSNSWGAVSPGPYGATSGTGYMPPGFVRARYRLSATSGSLIGRTLNP